MRANVFGPRAAVLVLYLLGATSALAKAERTSVEVLYEGPSAAGGVVSPKDIMAKELSDAGFEVLLSGPGASGGLADEFTPAVPSRGPAAPPTAQPPAPPAAELVVSRSASGLTVKQIFDFVRSVQQGKPVSRTQPPGALQFMPSRAFTLPATTPAQVVIAMRCSLRRLRESQGIFSTEAQMQIVAVRAAAGRIQTVITMMGPDKARGFGLDWEQAEEKALREVSAQMCPAFAKKLRQKLVEEK
jgi:hypothetical protein